MASSIVMNSITSMDKAILERQRSREKREVFVLTNGCFDILHSGHVYGLVEAAKLGNCLWVALNSDESVRSLKGNERPIMTLEQRGYILSNLKCVDGVITFSSDRLSEEILKLEPDVYVKSSDYDINSIDSAERSALEKVGAKIEFVPSQENLSTTSLISKIRSQQL